MANLSVDDLEVMLRDVKAATSAASSLHKRMGPRIRQLRRAIEVAKERDTTTQMRITDHAVVRWLSRVRGMDIDAIRDEIRGHLEGKFDKGENHDVIVIPEENCAVIVRGGKHCTAVTVLSMDHELPTKGQLKRLPSSDDIDAYEIDEEEDISIAERFERSFDKAAGA